MTPWRIVFMGTPDFAVPTLQALLDGPDEVVGVFTQPDKPVGRGMKERPTPVKKTALAANVPVFQPQRMRNPEALAQLQELKADLAVVAAYGQILPKSVLDAPVHGCINVHGSLLPRWRGAAPIQRALMAGDEHLGVTIMQMDIGLDTGDMLLKGDFPSPPEMTGGQAHDQMADLGAELTIKALASLKAGALIPQPQPEEGVLYAKKLNRTVGAIDWSQPAHVLQRHVHALNPWPAAYASLGKKRVKLFACRISAGEGVPGTLIAQEKDGPVIACGQGALLFTELQSPGKRRMAGGSWLRGQSLELGSTFT